MKDIEKEFAWGYYLCSLRQFYSISQKEMAKILEISPSTLSKVEQGQRNMKNEKVKLALTYFENQFSDYHFDKSLSKLSQSEKILEEALEDFIHLTYKNKLQKYENYLFESSNRDCFGFFNYKLVEIFYLTFIKKDTLEAIRQLFDLNCFQDDRRLSILYDLFGCALDGKDYDTLKQKLLYLKKAKRLCQETDHFEDLIGLIDYHIIRRYKELGMPEKTLSIFPECKQFLQNANAYIRLISLLAVEGCIYQQLNLYSSATTIYWELEKSCELLKTNLEMKSIAYDNLAWCEFVQQHFRQAIHYATYSYKLKSTFPDIYIILSFANIKLTQIQEALKWIECYKHQERISTREKFIGQFLYLLEKGIKSQKEGKNLIQDIDIEEIIQNLPFFHDVELEIALYPFLVDHYSYFKQYKTALKYEHAYNDYLLSNFCIH